jgi:DNA helicase II / ATP-dependent DNA helicase PcrA
MQFGSVTKHRRSCFIEEMPSVEVIGDAGGDGYGARPQPAAMPQWRQVAIHENAGAGVGLNLVPGDRVRHAAWGEGLVIASKAGGGDGLLTIDFPTVGRKMVMLKYAPLEKV